MFAIAAILNTILPRLPEHNEGELFFNIFFRVRYARREPFTYNGYEYKRTYGDNLTILFPPEVLFSLFRETINRFLRQLRGRGHCVKKTRVVVQLQHSYCYMIIIYLVGQVKWFHKMRKRPKKTR